MTNKLRRVLDGFKQLFYIDDRTDQEFANDMFESGEWKRDSDIKTSNADTSTNITSDRKL